MSTHFHSLNLCGVFAESKRIISAHSRHFLALSVFFLLPLSFSLVIYPTLQITLSSPNSIFSPRQAHLFLPYISTTPQPHFQSLLLPLFYTLFFVLISLFAIGTITYSTFHGFYGRPVKLISSIKSILYSFLPLLSTLLVSQVIVALICSIFGIFVVFAYKILNFMGLEMSTQPNYFAGFLIFVGILVGLLLIWLQLNWSLGSVVVVVESKWGYEPLRRSAQLLKGMRWLALSMMLFFGVVIGFLVWICSTSVDNVGEVSWWKSWAFILQTVAGSGFVALLMLHNVAANVVLYMYCKALHGELAFEIAEEFAREYVSLPFDEGKVPHVVCVVQD